MFGPNTGIRRPVFVTLQFYYLGPKVGFRPIFRPQRRRCHRQRPPLSYCFLLSVNSSFSLNALHDMPRNHNLGTSALRNRNRVTNKTRLKVVHGNIDADALSFDEDEEKARIVSTAGVDAEDANVSLLCARRASSRPC